MTLQFPFFIGAMSLTAAYNEVKLTASSLAEQLGKETCGFNKYPPPLPSPNTVCDYRECYVSIRTLVVPHYKGYHHTQCQIYLKK